MHTVAHIVNPFHAHPSSDLYVAQPITFESLRNAQQQAKSEIEVELLTAQFAEDIDCVSLGFRATRNLERSVLNIADFQKKIKLPLLMDILERAYEESAAEYIIYSNVDIGVYPEFYLRVKEYIDQGFDAFIINRRRLKSDYKTIDDLPKIFSDKGKSHPGFDCFVFHRSLFPKFKLEGICIGVPFIEISFSQNLFAFAHQFKLFDKEFLTFHIGMEIFKKRVPKEYFVYNQRCFWRLVPQFIHQMDLRKFPYSQSIWPLRIIKWGLHPCIPIRLVMKLLLRR